jgi:hypothetical protein
METHHPKVEKKNLKEYLLEGLMIFLAVTLGFLAENLREHFTERSKERQYIVGFIRNLKDDTADLRHVIESDRKQVKGLDTMLNLAHLDMDDDGNRKSFYHFATQYLYNSASFESNDVTLQQLKSTGDYRLIEKDHVVDSILKYDAQIRSIRGQGAFYEAYFKEILSRLEELTDMTIFKDSSFVTEVMMMNKTFPKLRDENGKLLTLFNKIFDFQKISQAYVEYYLEPQLKNAKSLIEFLRKEYGIED